jgi:hypothetical protein
MTKSAVLLEKRTARRRRFRMARGRITAMGRPCILGGSRRLTGRGVNVQLPALVSG